MRGLTSDALLEKIEQIAAYRESLSRRTDHLENYSLRRALDHLAHERRRGYFEAEVSQDLERTHNAEHGGLMVPWSVFSPMTRADIAGSAALGGFLTQTLNVEAEDALRPRMVLGPLGCTFLNPPFGANVSIPRLTGVATASWLTTEQSPVAETAQTFGQVALAPHTVGAYTEYSRTLFLQAGPSPVEFVIRRDLIEVIARALDYAGLFGSGINGQPHGIANLSGIQTFSGTSLSTSSVANAAVALGDALDETTGVAASLTTAGLLKTRQEESGSTRLMWEGSIVNGTSIGFPARSSSQITSGSYFLGTWRYLNVCVWGEGIEIVSNPYAVGNFQQGIVGVRAFLTADVAPTFPAAFNYASAVT